MRPQDELELAPLQSLTKEEFDHVSLGLEHAYGHPLEKEGALYKVGSYFFHPTTTPAYLHQFLSLANTHPGKQSRAINQIHLLRNALQGLCSAETPDECRQIISVIDLQPPSEENTLSKIALQVLLITLQN